MARSIPHPDGTRPQGAPMKRLAGWQLLVCVAVVLALRLLIVQSREANSPHNPAPVNPQRPLFPAWEGPIMQIDPDDLARAGRERDDNGVGMKFCWCPPGTFRMGSVPVYLHEDLVNGPVRVTISQGFWMGKFEVTQAQWQGVMGKTLHEQFEAMQAQWQDIRGKTLRGQRAKGQSQPHSLGDGSLRDHAGEGPDHPVYFTSHAEVEQFCRKLTEAERSAGRLDLNWEYRLPTEAQWEFACRAGTTTATTFGDRFSSTQANFDGSRPFKDSPAGPYLHETTPVGHYPANSWGLHDMHGNVSEWCRDCFTALPGGTDPVVEPLSPRRAFRGGCWYDPGAFCLSTTRNWVKVDTRGSGIGFRVALVPTGP